MQRYELYLRCCERGEFVFDREFDARSFEEASAYGAGVMQEEGYYEYVVEVVC